MKIKFFIYLLIAYKLSLVLAEPCAQRLTIYVDAGRTDCVYHAISKGEKINVEYQVIDGGRLDINFVMIDPHQSVIVLDQHKEREKHSSLAHEMGVYGVCFDNTFSAIHRKTVMFLLEVISADAGQQEKEYWTKEMMKDFHMTNTLMNITSSMSLIKVNLLRSRRLQGFLRAIEARDRNLVESNCSLVKYWSQVQFSAMIVVGLLQVYVLRSIFEKKDGWLSLLLKWLWKKIKKRFEMK